MIKHKLTWVEDAQHFYKWSSTRWQAFLAVLLLAASHLPELIQHLPLLLMWVQNNWPGLQPILAHYFPSVTQANWLVIAQVVGILLRSTSIEKKPVT